MRRVREDRGRPSTTRYLPLIAVAFALVVLLPLSCGLIVSRLRSSGGGTTRSDATLRLAYSPEKAALFATLLPEFERQGLKTTSGHEMRVELIELLPEDMLEPAVDGQIDAVSPDSSLWLTAIDEAWQEAQHAETLLVGESVRYAISPVVIAIREDVARSMGYPDRPLGWTDIIDKARSDESFAWSHASTSTASGLLATLAEFYAGAGKTRGLTIEDVTSETTLQYVAAVEATVKQYGEGELATIQRALEGGGADLDAFVVQEQLVIYYNTQSSDRLVAVYPVEGTLWEDHPLALLESPGLSADARETFQALKRFLLTEESQRAVLALGYRPADLTIGIDGSGSPISLANGVDPSQPQTVLQMPSAPVVQVVRDAWWYTKRHTNVYLVVDSSGSMSGEKITNARLALAAFLDSIRGDMESVGLIEFSSVVERIVPLAELGSNRTALEMAVSELEVGGDTALIDAVAVAYEQLQELDDEERINAIVVMTDGRENASRLSLRQLTRQIASSDGVPVAIFCIAYGEDADMDVLRALAEAGGGQVRQGDTESIQDLYRTISTYF